MGSSACVRVCACVRVFACFGTYGFVFEFFPPSVFQSVVVVYLCLVFV